MGLPSNGVCSRAQSTSLGSQSFQQLTFEPTTRLYPSNHLNRKPAGYSPTPNSSNQSTTCRESDGSDFLTWRPQSKTLAQEKPKGAIKTKPIFQFLLFFFVFASIIWPSELTFTSSTFSYSALSPPFCFVLILFLPLSLTFLSYKISLFLPLPSCVLSFLWRFHPQAFLAWSWPYLCLASLLLLLVLHLVSPKSPLSPSSPLTRSFTFCF